MYTAKDYGGDNFRFFTDEMNAQVVERLTLENSYGWRSTEKNSSSSIKPQMDIGTGKITGLEALLRWQHPNWVLCRPTSSSKLLRTAV